MLPAIYCRRQLAKTRLPLRVENECSDRQRSSGGNGRERGDDAQKEGGAPRGVGNVGPSCGCEEALCAAYFTLTATAASVESLQDPATGPRRTPAMTRSRLGPQKHRLHLPHAHQYAQLHSHPMKPATPPGLVRTDPAVKAAPAPIAAGTDRCGVMLRLSR